MGTEAMTEAEAIVFTEVYKYERERGAIATDAANTAAYAVFRFKREAQQ